MLAIARAGAAAGCTEALFTLGDKPELRYKVARAELAALGCETTLEYLGRVAKLVLEETGLLPHLNPGVMSRDELVALRPVSASMGIMLETASERLSAKGGAALGLAGQGACPPPRDDRPGRRAADPVHERDPDRDRRDAGGADRGARGSARAARAARPPAGGDRAELPRQAGHADGGASRAEPRRAPLDDRGRAAAAPADVSVQAPPNLAYDDFPRLLDAGIDDWGGVSPVTIDHVNPEAPWPDRDRLAAATRSRGLELARACPSTRYLSGAWVDPAVLPTALRAADALGLAREDGFRSTTCSLRRASGGAAAGSSPTRRRSSSR